MNDTAEWTVEYVMHSLATMDKICASVIADAHNAALAVERERNARYWSDLLAAERREVGRLRNLLRSLPKSIGIREKRDIAP